MGEEEEGGRWEVVGARTAATPREATALPHSHSHSHSSGEQRSVAAAAHRRRRRRRGRDRRGVRPHVRMMTLRGKTNKLAGCDAVPRVRTSLAAQPKARNGPTSRPVWLGQSPTSCQTAAG